MVVVIGAGITGASTAYYLSQQQQPVTVIDAMGVGTCSKAAAFLSESWGDGTKTEALHRKSFALHLHLAQELGLKSFQEIPAFTVDEISQLPDTQLLPQKPGRHALVDPQELVTALMNKAQLEHGATLEIQAIEGLEMDSSSGHATGIRFENIDAIRSIQPDEPIVVCMGPWASRLEDWLGEASAQPIPVDGVLSTSLVYQQKSSLWSLLDSTPSAYFCNEDMNGCHLELYRRVDQSLYVSGLGNSKPLKAAMFRSPNRIIPGQEQPSRPDTALCSLQAMMSSSSSSSSNNNHNAKQQSPYDEIRACIRPQSPDGIPIVGKVAPNIYVATGGGPWGITWGPLMGKIVANMICDKDYEPLARPLNPTRFDTVVQRSLMARRTKEAWS